MNSLLMDISLENLATLSIDSEIELRSPLLSDYIFLGELDFHAILAGPEYDGGSLQEHILEMKNTLEGKYGDLILDSSFLIEQQGQIISACLITKSNKEFRPLVANLMTLPNFQKNGLGKYLLKKALFFLKSAGYKTAFLAVHKENLIAISLYKGLGFTFRNYDYVVISSDYKKMRDSLSFFPAYEKEVLELEAGSEVSIVFIKNAWCWCRAQCGGVGWVPQDFLVLKKLEVHS